MFLVCCNKHFVLIRLYFRGRKVWKGKNRNLSIFFSQKILKFPPFFPKHLPFSSPTPLPQTKPRSKQLAKHQQKFTRMWKATKKSYLCSESKQPRKRQMSECAQSEVYSWKIYMVAITSMHELSQSFCIGILNKTGRELEIIRLSLCESRL